MDKNILKSNNPQYKQRSEKGEIWDPRWSDAKQINQRGNRRQPTQINQTNDYQFLPYSDPLCAFNLGNLRDGENPLELPNDKRRNKTNKFSAHYMFSGSYQMREPQKKKTNTSL